MNRKRVADVKITVCKRGDMCRILERVLGTGTSWTESFPSKTGVYFFVFQKKLKIGSSLVPICSYRFTFCKSYMRGGDV
jgi:hypothetical protein